MNRSTDSDYALKLQGPVGKLLERIMALAKGGIKTEVHSTECISRKRHRGNRKYDTQILIQK